MTLTSRSPGRTGIDLLDDHVDRFNAGVRSADFTAMVEGFTDDAELVFEGVAAGPFHGRSAIADAYRLQPPDDEIDVLGAEARRDGSIDARYAWRRDRGTLAGHMILTPSRDRIARLVVTFEAVPGPARPPIAPDEAVEPVAPIVQVRAEGGPAIPRTFDPAALRGDFPILSTPSHGRPDRRLIYLDSAATSQKPKAVIEAMDYYYRTFNANVHRGIYEIGERATAEYEAARVKIAKLINAPEPHEIVAVRNATEAINLVAYSWGRRNIRRGDAIILTELEHHANLVPWQLLAQEVDGDLEFIPINDDGTLRLDVFEVLLRLKPKLVSFTHVSNTLGTINPVRQMTEMAHAAGALVLVDGAQAVPHMPVDVQEIGCDFYAFSGHKTLGPTGSGALWARREILEAMPPFLAGGEMIREVHLRRSEWNDIPWKFEAGTPDIAAQIGLGVAAEYLMGLGMDNVREHERQLVAYALDTLRAEIPGIDLYGPPADQRGGVVAFNLAGVHPHDVAQVLDRYGVAVRAGHHCTMPLHERLDLDASARASFSVFTTREDIDALVEALRETRRIFGLVERSSPPPATA